MPTVTTRSVAPWLLALVATWSSGGIAVAQLVPPVVAPFTVQVAALSDPNVAIDLSASLLRERFPSYVVRAEGTAGAVYRVRVGAFGDRASADAYARALEPFLGSPAAPALAEAIPSGLIDWAPVQLHAIDPSRPESVEVVPWGLDVALKIALDEVNHEFRPLDGSAPFTAIDAWSEADVTEEIVRLDLDGSTTAGDDPSVREALFRQRVRLLADLLAVDADTFSVRVVRGEVGERHVVVWRQRTSTSETIVSALAASADVASRDDADWSHGVPAPSPTPVLTLRSDDAATGNLSGDGWTALSDGGWTSLDVGDRIWRLLWGTPVAAAQSLLVARVDDRTILYRIAPR